MGKIVETAKKFTHPDEGIRYSDLPFSLPNEERFLMLMEAIESEIAEQDKRIEDIEVGVHNLFEMLKRRTGRIEALEEPEKQIEYLRGMIDLQSFKEWLQSKYIRPEKEKDVPYDRHGKPPGGLEKWDVISYPYTVGDREFRMFGQFIRMRPGNKVWGRWKNYTSTDKVYPDYEYEVDQRRVIFEFRPKPEKS